MTGERFWLWPGFHNFGLRLACLQFQTRNVPSPSVMRLNKKRPFQFARVYWLQVAGSESQVNCGAPFEPATLDLPVLRSSTAEGGQPATDSKTPSIQPTLNYGAGSRGAHTLAEVMVSVGLLGIMVVSLFAGFSSGFDVVRSARENVRATQILEERMEVIRLVKWDNVAPGFIPTNFTVPFYAAVGSNVAAGGLTYTGAVSFPSNGMGETYATT